MNPNQAIANIPNQLLGNLGNIAEQHWLAVTFVVALVGIKVYVDLKLAARKGRERRQRNQR